MELLTVDTNKIKELIAELEEDIKLKVDVLQNLQKLVGSANGHKLVGDQRDFAKKIAYNHADSYVDLAVKIIQANEGRPMPIIQIVEHIRALKGNPEIERRSVEATLYQHTTNKGDSSRVVKVSPGVYGLRRYPRSEEPAA